MTRRTSATLTDPIRRVCVPVTAACPPCRWLLSDCICRCVALRYTGGVDDQGRYDGVGKLIAVNGDVYSGEFKAGTFHGAGTYIFKKGGGSYTGEFRAGLFAGQGREVYPDGSTYEGGFDNGKRSGHGTMKYANGAVFTGAWKTGKKEGRGLFRYSDGTRYEGRFVDGRREGTGFIYDKKNRKLQGKWKNGKMLNGGKLTRVLHKEKAAGSGEEDGECADTTLQYLLPGSTAAAIAAAAPSASTGTGGGAGSSDEMESKDSFESPPLDAAPSSNKLRHRSIAAAAAGSGTGTSGGVSAHSTPKRLSASREKELTNQLLNFHKKQAGLSASMARAADRHREELISQLAAARARDAAAAFGASGAASSTSTGSSSSSSSSSSSASTSHSSAASTTAASPMLQASARPRTTFSPLAYESALNPLTGESSGIESELAGSAADDDGDSCVHAPLGGRASSEVGDWTADDPTHVSNSHSHAVTPLPNASAHLSPGGRVHPAMAAAALQRAASKLQRSRPDFTSGSDKESESGSSPRATVATQSAAGHGGARLGDSSMADHVDTACHAHAAACPPLSPACPIVSAP